MVELSTTDHFLDGVATAVRSSLAQIDLQEAALDQLLLQSDRESALSTLEKLECNLGGWQNILGDMADKVRTAQDDLALLDADLKRSLDAFAVARKHLQGRP